MEDIITKPGVLTGEDLLIQRYNEKSDLAVINLEDPPEFQSRPTLLRSPEMSAANLHQEQNDNPPYSARYIRKYKKQVLNKVM